MTEPTPGTDWRHRNGNRYTVVVLANTHTEDPDRYPVTVVYRGENGRMWARPLSDWHRSMTADLAAQPGGSDNGR